MTQHLKKKSDLHIARKLWHCGGVTAIIILNHNLSRPAALQAITIFAVFSIIIDLLRQQVPTFNKAIIGTFQVFMREHERNSWAGISYLLLGVFSIVLIFPKDIVSLSLLFLAIADPLASYVGILYGRDRIIGNKTLQGTLAAFSACMIVAAVFYFSRNLMVERLLIVSVLSGFIGALAEALPIGPLDDNLSFPLLCSAMLYCLFYLFGGF